MAFCSNCGTQIQEGDQFCPNCGAQLAGYQTPQNGPRMSPPKPVNTAQIGEYFNEMLSVILGMLTKPATTIKYAAEHFKMESSFILLGTMIILQSLLSMWMVKQIMGGINNTLGGYMSLLGGGFGVSYGKIFGTSLLTAVVVLAALSACIFVMGRFAFKGQGSFSSVMNVVIGSYVPYVIGTLACIILSYVSPLIGQLVFVAGALLFMYSLYNGTRESMKSSDDSTIFTLTTGFAVLVLVLLLVLKIFVKAKMNLPIF